MTATSASAFPTNALEWLIDAEDARLLALGRTCGPLLAQLAARGHRLTANDPDPAGVRKLLQFAPLALPTVAEPDRLPFVPHAFDAILINRSLHTLRLETALPELARVLRPGGHLAISYTIRDDSVPWVRRLVALMRSVDPEAMTGAYGHESVAALHDSPLFPLVQDRSFRQWVPISRGDLMTMVASRFSALAPDELDPLLVEVGRLYETSARVPEPLLLPYRVACWRAYVDHSDAPPDLGSTDQGLSIRL